MDAVINIYRELISTYSKYDNKICELAAKHNLVLMGGTALEVWLNIFNLKGWRSRSDNDLDFTGVWNKCDCKGFIKDLLDLGLRLKKVFPKPINKDNIKLDPFYYKLSNNEVEVDILLEVKSIKVFKVRSLHLVSPEYIIESKLSRLEQSIGNLREIDRRKKDWYDILDATKVIAIKDHSISKIPLCATTQYQKNVLKEIMSGIDFDKSKFVR